MGSKSRLANNNKHFALYAEHELFPKFFLYHWIIQVEALGATVQQFDHVTTVITHVVNYIRSSSFNHRFFKPVLNISYAGHGDVRRLSSVRTLKIFCRLLEKMIFLDSLAILETPEMMTWALKCYSISKCNGILKRMGY